MESDESDHEHPAAAQNPTLQAACQRSQEKLWDKQSLKKLSNPRAIPLLQKIRKIKKKRTPANSTPSLEQKG